MVDLFESQLLRRILFDVLKPASESGDNPYLITINDRQFWIYLKNLSPAYFNNPDVWRVQLPKREKFEPCKNADIPFILLGYDSKNDVYCIWNHHYVKQRLNVVENVSLYSRASLQLTASQNNSIIRQTLANEMEVICFPRAMVSDVISKIEVLFPNDKSNYVALNSKRRSQANNTFKYFTSTNNIRPFYEYLINVMSYSSATANNYSGAIKRFITQGIFTKYRADFLAFDDVIDYSKAVDIFLSHDDIQKSNIVSRHVHSNALKQYLEFLCLSYPGTGENVVASEMDPDIDWEARFINEEGKLTCIANPKLIEFLRPVLQTEYPRTAVAYNIITEFYGSRFEDTMEMKDWAKLIDSINWDYQSEPKCNLESTKSPRVKKCTNKGRLSVTFPDGRILSYPNSTKTYLEVIENSYPDLIIEMGIEINGGNLIHTSNDKPRLHEIKGGFFVDVNYRTDVKVQILRKISDELELNLVVEQFDIHDSEAIETSENTAVSAIILPSKPLNPSKRDRIRVSFPDGYSVCEKFNKDTLAAVVTRAGVDAVFNLRLKAWGNGTMPLMSDQPIQGYEKFCIEIAPHRFLQTNSSTSQKMVTIQHISDLLNLHLKIELLKGRK